LARYRIVLACSKATQNKAGDCGETQPVTIENNGTQKSGG
jgi:hypothetical protein